MSNDAYMHESETGGAPYVPQTNQNNSFRLDAINLVHETQTKSPSHERPQHDAVNHPSHYTEHPSGVECIQITEHMNFCLGNAVKYIWRAGLKDQDAELQDLEKAAWYINREIDRRKRLSVG